MTTAQSDARQVLTRLRKLADQIANADQKQRVRLAERYDLALAAREAGATWAQINVAAQVANMQATINGKRPEV